MAKWQLIIPALIGGSVVVGGTAAYLYLKGIPSQVGIDPIASAKLVPDEALMASFMSGDDRAWSQLKKFGTPEAQKIFSDGLAKFTSDVEQSAATQDIDVEKDILPWVGSVMVALLPAKNAEPQQPLMVVGIKDKLAALNFANKMKDKGKSTIKEKDYKGIKVLEDTKSQSFLAILENHLLISNQQKTVELAIDTSKGEPSMVSESTSEMNDVLTDFKNPVAQIYIPNYAALVESTTATPLLPTQFLDQLNQVRSVVVGIGIEEQGLRMRAIAAMNPDAPTPWTYKPIPGTVVSKFPEETLALVSGSGISESWSAGVEQLNAVPELQQALTQVRQQLQQATQLDLDRDLFGWMDGEFAFALIPSQEGLLAELGFGGAVLLETSDRNTAEKTYGKLDTFATKNLLQLSERKIESTQVTEWQIPVQGTLISHGWLNQNTTFLALGGPMADILASKPAKTLDNSKTFQAATASLPKQNSGYFYVNMEQAAGTLFRNPLIASSPWLTPETRAILESMRAVGATTSQLNETTLQTDIVMALQPASK
jgi:hypothetical protein